VITIIIIIIIIIIKGKVVPVK